MCWSGLPFPSPRDLPDPGIEPRSPALRADILPSGLPGKLNLYTSIFNTFHLVLYFPKPGNFSSTIFAEYVAFQEYTIIYFYNRLRSQRLWYSLLVYKTEVYVF